MLTAIPKSTPAESTSAIKSVPKSAQQRPESKAPSGGPDTVKLSGAAQAALAAVKEATETTTQTAKEAGSGDLQAQRLLAKETAAAKQLSEK